MPEISGLVDLKTVCRGLVYKMRLEPYWQTRFFQYGIDATTQLKLYTLGETKVEKLEMNTDINTISFPNDFMKYVDIGIPIGGKLWSLTKENTIIDTTTIVNGKETYDEDIGEGNWDIVLEDGAGGYNTRFYKVDEKNRRIVVSGTDLTTIWLVYISTGVNTSEPTYVHRAMKPAIEAFVRHEYALDSPGEVAANKLFLYKKDLKIQKARLKRLKYPTVNELRDSLAKSFYRHAK
jgi:hypothetical protein